MAWTKAKSNDDPKGRPSEFPLYLFYGDKNHKPLPIRLSLGSDEQIFGADEQVRGRRPSD
jgi:hypothetical protein